MKPEIIQTTCCVVGGGPAGMMSGLLFARAGVPTLVIEKHSDFLRDFRGDTVHPSTTEVLAELGLLDAFLKMDPDTYPRLGARFGDQKLRVADFSRLPTKCKFISLIPQWDFLDFLADHAKILPDFSLRMNTEATDLIETDGRICGIRASSPEGDFEIHSSLVIAADGRSSRMRDCAGFEVKNIGAPIDVLWFRVSRPQDIEGETLLNAGNGQVVITINRGDYWQCAFVISKGKAANIKAGTLSDFKDRVVGAAPVLKEGIDSLTSFDDVKLLSVSIDRLEKWSRSGLVMIGDSAHAMSPVGGVGINLAIQDAVAAANLLAEKLASGELQNSDLDLVRQRRLWPTKLTQWVQVRAQNGIVKPLIENATPHPKPPLLLRLIARFPFLQRRIGSAIGLGARPEHVNSPGPTRVSK